MKILHINTFFRGGAGIASFRLHQGLRDQGIESKMLIRDPVPRGVEFVYKTKPTYGFLKQILINQKLIKPLSERQKRVKQSIEGDFEMFSFASSDFKLHEHPLVKEADIIHLHWISNFVDYKTFFKNIDKPIVWTIHDMNPFQGGFHYLDDLLRNKGKLENSEYKIKKKNFIINKSLDIVTLSNWMRNLSEKSELLSPYKHHLIRNGIPFDYTPPTSIVELKTKLGISLEKPVFIFISDNITVRRKGFDILIEALQKISTDVQLIAIGRENSLDLSLDVKFTGYINNHNIIYDYLSISDAFLLPSREDNLPNVMLESLLCGTPVIAFNTGGMKDVLKDGINAVLAENINADEFLYAIERFLESKDTFVSKKISIEAKHIFNINAMSKSYVNLYQDILKR